MGVVECRLTNRSRQETALSHKTLDKLAEITVDEFAVVSESSTPWNITTPAKSTIIRMYVAVTNRDSAKDVQPQKVLAGLLAECLN